MEWKDLIGKTIVDVEPSERLWLDIKLNTGESVMFTNDVGLYDREGKLIVTLDVGNTKK